MKKQTNIIFPILKYTIFFSGILWMMFQLTLDLKEDRETYEKRPSYSNSPLKSGAILYKNGELDKAAQSFDQLLKLDPNNYETRMMLAEVYHEQCIKNDTLCEQALWQLTFLIQKFPDKITPLEMRSKIFLKLNDTISYQNDVSKISNLFQYPKHIQR